MNEKKLEECIKCKQLITYSQEDTYWDYSCSGYDVRLVKCPICGTPIVLGYKISECLYSKDDENLFF